jgi:hypothetical protein
MVLVNDPIQTQLITTRTTLVHVHVGSFDGGKQEEEGKQTKTRPVGEVDGGGRAKWGVRGWCGTVDGGRRRIFELEWCEERDRTGFA